MKILWSAVLALLVLLHSAQAQTVRAAVGEPLQHAQTRIAAGDYAAALRDIDSAAEVPGLSGYEKLVIAQLRGAAAAGEGDYPQAASAYQAVLAAPQTPAAERLPLTQAIAGFYYQAGEYGPAELWVKRYIAAGGTDPDTRALLAQAYYENGDYAGTEAAVQAQTAPNAAALQLFASAAQKAGDPKGYATAIDDLLRVAPSAQYWEIALGLVENAPDFPDAATIDLYRLRLATGTLTDPEDYEDYAERAILAGQKLEARNVVDAGFAAGVLNAQTDAGHAQRLRALVDQPGAANAPVAGAVPLDAAVARIEVGDFAAAQGLLAQVPGPEAGLAQLWSIYAQGKAAGKN
jgi:hypothetical protein